MNSPELQQWTPEQLEKGRKIEARIQQVRDKRKTNLTIPENTQQPPFDLTATRAHVATLTDPIERVNFLNTLTLKNRADMMGAELVDGLNAGVRKS